MNQRKAGTLLSYAYIIITNTISLFYTPYMLRMMGQSEYGLYGTASSIISYLSILNFGIGGAYIRFNAIARAKGDKNEERWLNGMFLSVFGILALLVLLVGLVFVAMIGTLVKQTFSEQEILKVRIIMFILIINMMITFICNVFMMALQAYEQFFTVRFVLLLAGILQPILNVIALKMGGRSITITVVSLVVSASTYFIFYLYARKQIHFEVLFHGFDKTLFYEIFVFSGFLFLNSVTDQITFSTDNVILSSVHGAAAVAVYSVGSSFKGYFMSFSSSISSVFAPQVNQLVAKQSDIKILDEIFVRIGRIQFYIVSLILLGFASIGHPFICIWAGEDYGDAFYIGLLLMLAVAIPSFQNVGLEIQKAKNMHKARSIVYFLVALINVLMTIPLSKMYSGIGAALATTICMFIGTVIFMNWYYQKHIGLNIIAFWKSIAGICKGLILPVLVCVAINRYWNINSYIDVLMSALVIVLIYAGSVWFFSMNQYEKELFSKPFLKMLSRMKC